MNRFVAALSVFFLGLGGATASAGLGILIARLQAPDELYPGGIAAVPLMAMLVSVPFLHYGVWLWARARGQRLQSGVRGFGIMALALVAAALTVGASMDIWRARRAPFLQPVEGRVVESRVYTEDRGYSSRRVGPRYVEHLVLKIAYSVGGQQYVGQISGRMPGNPTNEEVTQGYPVGAVARFFYDSEQPSLRYWEMPAPLAPGLAARGLLITSCLGAIYYLRRTRKQAT
jgi:hypothetical protein